MPYLMKENGMNVGESWHFLETVLCGGAGNDVRYFRLIMGIFLQLLLEALIFPSSALLQGCQE